MGKIKNHWLKPKPVLEIKEIPRTGSYEPVESHHCTYLFSSD